MEDFTNVSFGGKFSMVDFVGGLQMSQFYSVRMREKQPLSVDEKPLYSGTT